MTSAPLLRLRGITRTFLVPDAPPLRILTGVDLDVHPGEHVAVVGRSGTGKSTLLNILGLIDVPTSGGYQLNGVDTAGLGESRRAHLRGQTFGFVFQSFNLIAGLTTTENVAAPLLYDHGAAFWRRGSRARELLEAVGLKDKAGMSIGRLSGGEQQRVAIARALARGPGVILADEPTGALDSVSSDELLEFLTRCVHELGQTLVMVTHDPHAAGYADRLLRLADGRIVADEQIHRDAARSRAQALPEGGAL